MLAALVGLGAAGLFTPWILFPGYALVGGAVGAGETEGAATAEADATAAGGATKVTTAPAMARGTAKRMVSGSVKLSNWEARIMYATMIPSTSAKSSDDIESRKATLAPPSTSQVSLPSQNGATEFITWSRSASASMTFARAIATWASAWASGPAQLGYGDGDEVTVVEANDWAGAAKCCGPFVNGPA